MAQFPAMPFWTDAYLGDTTHLTTIEHGAYLLLLFTSWRSKDCCLPDDDKLLARYAKLGPVQWVKMRPVIEPFFKIENGVWIQQRLNDERVAVKQRREQKIIAGKASALKRHQTASTDVLTDAERLFNYPLTLTKTLNQEEDKKDTSYPKKSASAALPDGTAKTPATRGKRLKVYLDEIGEEAAGYEFGTWAQQELNLDAATINAEMAKFCDYWNATPGQKGCKLDWAATWRNWCRSVKEKITKEEKNREVWSRKR